MLYTNLKHIETAFDFEKTTGEIENVIVICGRMEPQCIPVYGIAEELEASYRHVGFFDMEFDNPETDIIKNLPVLNHYSALPYILYYKNGKLEEATSGFQSIIEIQNILKRLYPTWVKATKQSIASA